MRGLAPLLLVVAAAAQWPGNADESKVGPYTLPDPLFDRAGRRIATAADWAAHRAGLVGAFEDSIYGVTPPARAVSGRIGETGRWPAAKARRVQVRLSFAGMPAGTAIDLLLYLPEHAQGPVPVFVGANFHGNQAVADDPAIAPTRAWVTRAPGIVGGRATAASRGIDREEWPVAAIVAAGYGVATFAAGDVYPDRDGGYADSVNAHLPGPADPAARPGAMAAWAWGLSRALDWLRTRRDIDRDRIAVIGHSRFGKAALWAGARDPRFALVVSNDSGEGGAALYRRNFGETIRVMNDYWFAPRYKTYAGREATLPVDAHMLMALVAPRPLYVASATEDWWADPRGEFLAARGAGPVYRLFGRDGVPAGMPRPDHRVGARIGYHVRTGPHALTPMDWSRFIAFADREMEPRRRR